MQALYGTMNSEMSKWLPLPAYNPDARLYGIYQDSRSTTPISVNSEGYFETSLQVKSTDSNISFEIVTGDSACYPVEGVSTSDIATSEEGTTELISCPEQVITLPGFFMIFAVRGEPAINLKDSGLTFTLNDPSVGWVTEPFYLKCHGTRNYNIAYGIFLAKPGLTTPASTTITAQTATGLVLNIFTEVVKSCASISGHVGGAGVIPTAGFVYSIGFDSFSCLDEAGNYRLDKVFRGHFRKIVAVYWLQENGVLIKHREESAIDFFDSDLTGFDLPAGVLPTPTMRPPGDPFYDNQVEIVINYFEQLSEELNSKPQAIQQVIDWLNGNLSSGPSIPEGILKAYINEYKDTTIMIEFEDGNIVRLMTDYMPFPNYEEADAMMNSLEIKNKNNIFKKTSPALMTTSDVTTFKPEKILMLDPICGWQYWFSVYTNFFGGMPSHLQIAEFLKNNDYYKDKVKIKLTGIDDILFDFSNIDSRRIVPCHINPSGSMEDIVTPWDYDTMNEYGFVYINTHGSPDSLAACVYLDDHPEIIRWEREKQYGIHNFWDYGYQPIDFWALAPPLCYNFNPPLKTTGWVKTISLNKNFFRGKYSVSPPQNGIIYVVACEADQFSTTFNGTGVVYLGNSQCPCPMWTEPYTYYFFKFMLEGYSPYVTEPAAYIRGYFGPFPPGSPPFDSYKPMHLQEAHNALKDYFKVNPDPGDYSIWPFSQFTANFTCTDASVELYYPPSTDIYFPGGVEITVQEE